MADFQQVLSVSPTDWPWAELVARFALFLVLALVTNRALKIVVDRLWALGFDPARRLAHAVPVLRALLLLLVFLGTLAPLHEERPGSAALLAALGLGLATIWALPHLRDVAGGLVLALTRPFTAGDAVEIDGIAGQITTIGLTRIAILTASGENVWVHSSRVHQRHIRVAREGAKALAVDVEVPLAPGRSDAIGHLRDLTLLSPYVDLGAPVMVERVGEHSARVVATPTHFADEGALRGDLLERATRGV